jgi:RNA polymerase sigma-70 factor (ECF subfamily)
MAEPDDTELVRRCRAGDEAAFRELVDRYKDLVFALVVRTVPDRGVADDLAQDVFLRVHRGLPYFRGDSKLSTWIYRIAANVCAQHRLQRSPAVASIDERDERDRLVREPAAGDRAISDFELRERLEKAIARLAPLDRFLIAGHYLKGVQYEDLAQAVDLPLGTVKTHLFRARRRLRALLEGDL